MRLRLIYFVGAPVKLLWFSRSIRLVSSPGVRNGDPKKRSPFSCSPEVGFRQFKYRSQEPPTETAPLPENLGFPGEAEHGIAGCGRQGHARAVENRHLDSLVFLRFDQAGRKLNRVASGRCKGQAEDRDWPGRDNATSAPRGMRSSAEEGMKTRTVRGPASARSRSTWPEATS